MTFFKKHGTNLLTTARLRAAGGVSDAGSRESHRHSHLHRLLRGVRMGGDLQRTRPHARQSTDWYSRDDPLDHAGEVRQRAAVAQGDPKVVSGGVFHGLSGHDLH